VNEQYYVIKMTKFALNKEKCQLFSTTVCCGKAHSDWKQMLNIECMCFERPWNIPDCSIAAELWNRLHYSVDIAAFGI